MAGDGITIQCELPHDDFSEAWTAIKLSSALKTRLLAQSLLALTVRRKISFEAAPLHGFILLVGPPGTGKTTLARGLAQQIARRVKGKATFLQVDPHALARAALGTSQKAVTKLFETTLPEAALDGIGIVLLDEIETLAASREKLSLEANPIDVHRSTDAVLTGMDNLSLRHKNVLLIGTSNFPSALDRAVISRADLIQDIGLPDAVARQEIIEDTLRGIAKVWPDAEKLQAHAASLASNAEGLDGRAIRKAVFAAAAMDIDVAQDLNRLTHEQIDLALREALETKKAVAA